MLYLQCSLLAVLCLLFCLCPEAILDPTDISMELELPANEIGEILLSGWHVNTYQVSQLQYTIQDTPGYSGILIGYSWILYSKKLDILV